MFLLVGIVSISADKSIQSTVNSVNEQEPPQPGFPDPFPKHIKGNGTDIAFKIGKILIMIARLPQTTITYDLCYLHDPDIVITMYCAYVIAFGFKGDLVRQGSYFEFDGDAGLILYNNYILS